MEPHATQVLGRQRLPGVPKRLAVQRDFREIPRGAPTAPLRLPPLLRGAPQVAGLLRAPEGPALDIPKALLALGFPQSKKAPFEGVPHRFVVAQHVLGRRRKMCHGGEHAACWETRFRSLGGRGSLRGACPEAVVPETEAPDPACGVGPIIDCPL